MPIADLGTISSEVSLRVVSARSGREAVFGMRVPTLFCRAVLIFLNSVVGLQLRALYH